MPLRKRPFDLFLVCCFGVFAFTSLVMEPYFVFGVDYHRAGDPFAWGWLWYARFDPIFVRRPLWLRLFCGVDFAVYGPFYLLLMWSFWKRADFIRIPALCFVTAIGYSTLVYFAVEFLEERDANLPVVVLVIVPYLIVPALLAWRVRHANPFQGALHEPRSASQHLASCAR